METEHEEIHIPAPITVGEFFRAKLAPRLPGIGMDRILFAVNEEMVDTNHMLSDSDTLAVLPPLCGGRAQEMARLQLDDFNMDEETKLCIGPNTDVGGIATFVGVVRDISKGKKIDKIELTCYEPMAEKEMWKLRHAALEKFDVINITVVHRIGMLKAGERIVGIAVAARHRKDAFDACRWMIDELKKTVPIWKKEFASDGGAWVEGL